MYIDDSMAFLIIIFGIGTIFIFPQMMHFTPETNTTAVVNQSSCGLKDSQIADLTKENQALKDQINKKPETSTGSISFSTVMMLIVALSVFVTSITSSSTQRHYQNVLWLAIFGKKKKKEEEIKKEEAKE